MSEGYLRHLLSEEIADLEMNGCTADNWENIKVASPFHAEHVCNVHFSGSVALGLFEKEFTLPGGGGRTSFRLDEVGGRDDQVFVSCRSW